MMWVYPKWLRLLPQERRKEAHVIVIDNGDLIQGTPLAYHHARLDNEPMNPMVLGLNYLGYDASCYWES